MINDRVFVYHVIDVFK